MQRRQFPPLVHMALLSGAVSLALLGQYLFTGEVLTHRRDSNLWEWPAAFTLASICLLGALALAAAVGWSRWQDGPALAAPIAGPWRRLALVGASALGLSAGAASLFLLAGEGDLVWLLWGGGGAALIGGLWWAAPPAWRPSLTRGEWLAVAAITGVGACLRFWQLTALPDQLDNDAYWIGTSARALVDAGDQRWIGFSESAGHLQSYVQLYAWGIRLFGPTRLALVIWAALAGTLTIPAIYALGRELFSGRVGLVAATLLALNSTHIHFSRTMFGPVVTLLATLVFWLLARGLRRDEPVAYALAGLLMGSALLLYDAARVVPVVLLGLVGLAALLDRQQLAHYRTAIALISVGALVALLPLLAAVAQSPGTYLGRSSAVVLWAPAVWEHQQAVYGVSGPLEVVWGQVVRTLLAFHLYGDGSPQFGIPRPAVMPLTAVLLTIGLGGALARARQVRFGIPLLWLGLTLIFGGVLTYDPPFWPHLLIALPAALLLAAAGAELLVTSAVAAAGARAAPAAHVAVAAALLLSGFEGWHLYADYVTNNAGPRTRISRTISALPQGYAVNLISDEFTPDNYIFQYFNRDTPIAQMAPDHLDDGLPAGAARLFVVHHHDEILGELQRRYPAGELRHVTGRDGGELYITYRIGPPDPTPPAQPASLDWQIAFVIGALAGWGANVLWVRWRRRGKHVPEVSSLTGYGEPADAHPSPPA